MQQRSVCLELRTVCAGCGQPIPMNGPYRSFNCSACFRETAVPGDIIGDLLNDFEEEYEGLAEGEGTGGTLMSGSGTYNYSLWRLSPRCPACKTPLPAPDLMEPAASTCEKCGSPVHCYPAPEWLSREVPPAVFCVTTQAGPEKDGGEPLTVDENSRTPVVMGCPQCSGALSISTKSERVTKCGYCSSEVYVPDDLWKKMHPVRTAVEWFVILSGKSRKQLQAERRLQDEEEEKRELAAWKARSAPRMITRGVRPLLPSLGIAAAIALLIALISTLGGDGGGFMSNFGPVFITAIIIMIPVMMVVRTLFAGRTGMGGACKTALAELSLRHGWKHEGAGIKGCIGSVMEKYRGRDIEIDPSDEYAVEVGIDESVFYLRTDPPGYPPESMQRFTSGDPGFNGLFPIRYASAETVERMRKSREEEKKVLAPFRWFLDRWEPKIGRLMVDWSSVQAHLLPGHVDVMDTGGRYLDPADIEPLLEDMITLAAAIDAVGAGREPKLPSVTHRPPQPETPA